MKIPYRFWNGLWKNLWYDSNGKFLPFWSVGIGFHFQIKLIIKLKYAIRLSLFVVFLISSFFPPPFPSAQLPSFFLLIYVVRYHLVIVCIIPCVAAFHNSDLVEALPSFLQGISAFSFWQHHDKLFLWIAFGHPSLSCPRRHRNPGVL